MELKQASGSLLRALQKFSGQSAGLWSLSLLNEQALHEPQAWNAAKHRLYLQTKGDSGKLRWMKFYASERLLQ